jgi:hypothetical protein
LTEIKNALIADVSIEFSDRSPGIVARIVFDTGIKHHQVTVALSDGQPVQDSAGYWLCKFLLIANATSLRNAIGKAVRLDIDQDQLSIGHIVKNDWEVKQKE